MTPDAEPFDPPACDDGGQGRTAPGQGLRRSVPLPLFVIITLSLLAAIGGVSAVAVAAHDRADELVAALTDEKEAAEAAADEAEQVLHQAEAATSSAEARAIQAEQRERVAEQAALDAAAAAQARTQSAPSADEREFLELLRSNNPIFGAVDDTSLVDLANNACIYLGTMGGSEGDFVDLMDMGIAAGFTEYQTASVLSAATVAMCPEHQLLGG